MVVVSIISLRRIYGDSKLIFPGEALPGLLLIGMRLDRQRFRCSEYLEQEWQLVGKPSGYFPTKRLFRALLNYLRQRSPEAIGKNLGLSFRMGSHPQFGLWFVRRYWLAEELRDSCPRSPSILLYAILQEPYLSHFILSHTAKNPCLKDLAFAYPQRGCMLSAISSGF
jgi:hypothetical protein